MDSSQSGDIAGRPQMGWADPMAAGPPSREHRKQTRHARQPTQDDDSFSGSAPLFPVAFSTENSADLGEQKNNLKYDQ